MVDKLQQCLPLAVLKQTLSPAASSLPHAVATVLTACGIETASPPYMDTQLFKLQQCLPLAVCDEGCEAAEERGDDEDRTSLVPD